MDWNDLVRKIDRELPGLSLWMHCAPVLDDDSEIEQGVGLAVQRESGPGNPGRSYLVVFFELLPDPAALDGEGRFLGGRGDDPSDWSVRIGYQGEFDSLQEAIGEAKDLAPRLPTSALYPTEERLVAFLEKVEDPGDLEVPA